MRYDGYLNLKFLSCFLLLSGLILTKFFYNLDKKKIDMKHISWQSIIFYILWPFTTFKRYVLLHGIVWANFNLILRIQCISYVYKMRKNSR